MVFTIISSPCWKSNGMMSWILWKREEGEEGGGKWGEGGGGKWRHEGGEKLSSCFVRVIIIHVENCWKLFCFMPKCWPEKVYI